MTSFVAPGLDEVQAEFSHHRLALAGCGLHLGVWVDECVSRLRHTFWLAV